MFNEDTLKKNILIIGAGPAGLTAGYVLSKHDYSICFIEKEEEVGGLAKTLQKGELKLDIGPHILWADHDSEMNEFIQELMGEQLFEYYPSGKRYLEDVLVGEKKYHYPIQITNALKNAGLHNSIRYLRDYLFRDYTIIDDGKSNYEFALIKHLGRSLSQLFLTDICQKTYGFTADNLSSDLMKRVDRFSILIILKEQINSIFDRLKKRGDKVNYPYGGIGQICNSLKEKIGDNVNWCLSSKPTNINIIDNKVISVTYLNNDGCEKTIHPEHIISTIPLYSLMNIITPRPENNIIEAAINLKYRSHIAIYIVFKTSQIMKNHDIYISNPEVPFVRIMEQKHYCDNLIPGDNKTVLTVEYICWNTDNLWMINDDELYELTKHWLKKLSIISNQEVIEYFTHRENDAYPVYDKEYSKYRNLIKKYIENINNLDSIGRAGEFIYATQYEAMRRGRESAEMIINKNMRK